MQIWSSIQKLDDYRRLVPEIIIFCRSVKVISHSQHLKLLNMTTSGRCAECGAILHGRSDKKFCDDQCRSTFNNKSYALEYKTVNSINRILLSNRRILGSLLKGSDTSIKWSQLLALGFNPDYCTAISRSKGNDLVYHCYEYKWQKTGLIVRIYDIKKGEI